MIKIVTAHTAVFDENGRILMTMGRDIPLWVFPGGHVEDGEDPAETAKRELFEEVGIVADNFELVGEYLIEGNKIKRFYKAKASSKDKFTLQLDEVRKAVWFEPEKLPSQMREYDSIKIQDLLKFEGEVFKREFDKNPNYDLWPLFLRFPLWMIYVMFCYYRWMVRDKLFPNK